MEQTRTGNESNPSPQHIRDSSRARSRVVVLTGAGISAPSGLQTFRGGGGLWEGHRVEEVASPLAWAKHPERVLEFYNQRRAAAVRAQPNAAHLALVRLEARFEVQVITQNVDTLHERAGSRDVLHLHGRLDQARSTWDDGLVVDLPGDRLDLGDRAPDGSQLRPHIVWFGEPVPAMVDAVEIVSQADRVIVAGTSLQVYPAAGLVECAPAHAVKVYIDLQPTVRPPDYRVIAGPVEERLPALVEEWLAEAPGFQA